mgnify:CR=1 FL=1
MIEYELNKADEQNLLKFFNELPEYSRVLFLENGDELDYSAEFFENWLIENKIQYNCLFDIKSLPMAYIINQINEFDVIIFQTTWTYERSFEIKQLLTEDSLITRKKIVIESMMSFDPSWYEIPHGVKHDMYFLRPQKSRKLKDNMQFVKLAQDVRYWDRYGKF